VVVLAPSFSGTADWKAYGAIVATKESIDAEIDNLRRATFEATLVIVNRYDGIDLPDDMCRILVFDSKPYSESLIDRYEESCRSTSELTAIRTARTVEQGSGRSVRGEKDYCAIILTGPELIKTIRSQSSRKHLSNQTRMQIEIGLEIAEMAKDEIDKGVEPWEALRNLVNQCLKRDPDWKAFYAEKMNSVQPAAPAGKELDVFQLELQAEMKSHDGNPQEAVKILQGLLDKYVTDDADRGWYMQEMARHTDLVSKVESNKLQLEAHRKNRYLMKPRSGMQIDRITVVSQRRVDSIISWIKRFESYDELAITFEDILSRLQFGVKADRFEQGLHELGIALGFSCQRPDKEWKAGPDNLWGVRDNEYLLFECKSEVSLERAEIHKGETGQINNACAWFAKNYSGANVTRIMIIPTDKLGKAAGFNEDVLIMRSKELRKLTRNVRAFFAEFKSMDFKDLSEKKVQELIDAHGLSVEALISNYSKNIRS